MRVGVLGVGRLWNSDFVALYCLGVLGTSGLGIWVFAGVGSCRVWGLGFKVFGFLFAALGL